jgi:AraC-like DNA-binding protein/mannose-6-phosphate isomerase-like protein (cupin superfamily)
MLLTGLSPQELLFKEKNSNKAGQIEYNNATHNSEKPLVYYYVFNDNVGVQINNIPLNVKNEVLQRKTPPSFHVGVKGVMKWLCIQKHVRFVPHFDHMHTYVEINYMYSGSCINMVDGHEIRMEAGDFVFMKPGSVHSILWAGENDILVNIILMPHAAGAILDKTLIGANDLSAFLIEALFSDTTKPNHLFLKMRGTESIQNAMARLMCEYFDPDRIAAEVLAESYLRIVFALLWRESSLYPQKVVFARKTNAMVADIISYIHEYCTGCTRGSVAEHIGYDSNYISNLLVENTGKSFVTIRNEFRMEHAEKLLCSSDIPVRDVAEQCGFTNITQFYKVYREYFGYLPRKSSHT